MSLENEIKKLAVAIEANTLTLSTMQSVWDKLPVLEKTRTDPELTPPQPAVTVVPVPPAPQETSAAVTAPAPPSATTVPGPPVPPVENNTVTPLAAEDVNAVLVAESKRLGSSDGIMEIIKSYGVTGVTQLDSGKYQELINKVKAL